VPTPRLRAGFKRLDPVTIPKNKITEAASLSKGTKWAEDVPLATLPRMDAIVCGSVAVTRGGHRCGKGEGYSDLEYAILRELGHPPVPVATTVHRVQVVAGLPRHQTDLPLSVIVTPENTFIVKRPPPAPKGIQWDRLTEENLQDMPILRDLRHKMTRRRTRKTIRP
jgi:5-formyltetrahydrofolate cyclo-ligase